MESIYMDARWETLQAAKEGGVACRYTHEHRGVRVIYPFIKRPAGTLAGIDYYDIVTPRGVAGIWLEYDAPIPCGGDVLHEAAQSFQENFAEFCKQERIIAEFVRFSPWRNDHEMFSSAYRMREYGVNYCNQLTRDFFHEEYPARKQSKIRKMQREGVEISFGNESSRTENFLRLYSYTQEKYKTSEYHRMSEEFLLKYLEAFPDEVVFAQAHFEGHITTSALILMGKDIAHLHLSGLDPAYHHLDANSLLLYETALYAAERGRKMFDLGDALKGSSLERFKQGMAKGYPYLAGTKVQDSRVYAQLVTQAGGPRENYFPAYRR